MFLCLNKMFIVERAAVVWTPLEKILGFDPSLEINTFIDMQIEACPYTN